MSFDWSQYLTLAADLAARAPNSTSPEAWFRSSLSRAYYAAFQVARQDLERQGRYAPLTGDNAHAYVRDRLKQDPNPSRRKLAFDLERLRTDRNEADYEDVVQGLETMVSSALILAQRVVSTLGQA